MTHSSLIYTLAGISMFMLGMTIASENLQKLAANRIRDLLTKVSDKPYIGVFVGVMLTILIQSSGAVTSMLVGLGSAGVVSLSQVMSVIIGTTIGTTFTVQLLSLNVAQFGLPIFTFSFIVHFLANKKVVKRAMAVVMGFGLIFWGLEIIGVGTASLKEAEVFTGFLSYLKGYPLFSILVTAAFTAVVHSSAVTIGLAMSLAGSGLISLPEAILWVYGANIGTTATALVASVGGNYIGRQVAWAHCFYKIASVLLFYFFTTQVAELLAGSTIERAVANVHTFINLAAAVVFYFLIHPGSRLIEQMFPPSAEEKEFSTKFINPTPLRSPIIVIARAEREVLRMGDIISKMTVESLELFRNYDTDLVDSIRERDDRVDLLNREINLFLAQHVEEADHLHQKQMMRLMSFSADLESVGDVIDNSILELSSKKHNLKLEFSEEGWQELEELYRMVCEIVSISLTCFQLQSPELAQKVVHLKREIRKKERELIQQHMQRLVKGRPESINTSSIHIDALGEYRRIAGLVSNHAYSYLYRQDRE